MEDDPAKRAWVTRVLGVTFPDHSGTADFAPALASWRQARAKVDADLAAFRAALVADESIKADSRLNFVRAAAAEIPNMLPAPGRKIEALLASGAPGPAAANDVLAAVGDYRAALNAATSLGKLEDFAARKLSVSLDVRATLLAAIDRIETTMKTAA
jgi:hypothetical protein